MENTDPLGWFSNTIQKRVAFYTQNYDQNALAKKRRKKIKKKAQLLLPHWFHIILSSFCLSCVHVHNLSSISSKGVVPQTQNFGYIYRLPFFFPATTLNAAAVSSSSLGWLDDFLATSLQPPEDAFVSVPAPALTGSTIPLSASLRRRMNSSAKRRPSSVWELAYTESEMISASAGSSSNCWTKSSTVE